MPAVSQQQQKIMGLALSVKRGETPESEVSDDVLKIVNSMSQSELEKYAGTEHDGLPQKVEQKLRETIREILKIENTDITHIAYSTKGNMFKKTKIAEFKSERAAKMWISKNSDKYFSSGYDSIGFMPIGEWNKQSKPFHNESVNEAKSYSNKFASWFTSTVLNTVKHPTYGKHQLTADQIQKSPADYKDKLFKAIDTAIKNGDISSADIKKNESIKEGTLYSSQQLIQKLTPKIEKNIETLKKQFPKYDITLVKNRYQNDNSYTLSISGKDTSTADDDKLKKLVASKIGESVNEARSNIALKWANMDTITKINFLKNNNFAHPDVLAKRMYEKLPIKAKYEFTKFIKESVNESSNPKQPVISKANWDRAHRDYKSIRNGQHYMMYLDKKTGGTIYGPVTIKESVKESIGTLIPKVGTINDFELKNLLLKNKTVLDILSDNEYKFLKSDKTDVIQHQSKPFNTIVTDGKLEFEMDLKTRKVIKPLTKARREILNYYSTNKSRNEYVNSLKEVTTLVKTKDGKLHKYPNFKKPDVINFLIKRGMNQVATEKELRTNFDFYIVESVNESTSAFGEHHFTHVKEAKMSDALFVADQLLNGVDEGHLDKREFISHLSKQTKFGKNELGKVFDVWNKLNFREKDDLGFSNKEMLKWLKKFGINESVKEVIETKMTKRGNDIFVDTNFVQASNKFGDLVHLGMGEFMVKTKDGNVDFVRVNKQINGFTGRTHKLDGNKTAILNLVKKIKPKLVKESVKESANASIGSIVKSLKSKIKEIKLTENKFRKGDLVRVIDRPKYVWDKQFYGKSGYVKDVIGRDILVTFPNDRTILINPKDLEINPK
jgi:hypothetical protein